LLKIHIIAVGEDKSRWVSEGISHFEKLLSRYAQIKWTIVRSGGKSSAQSPAEIRAAEKLLIQKHLAGGAVIALSDSGKKFDSPEFANKLEKLSTQSRGEIKFVIGGPFGLDKSILDTADEVISLSSLTFSHQIVRIVLLEQLFRAFSILHHTDYHK
jgi:23S rRNA (pseudouridine1915-N3)-methyltransferase